MVKGIYLECKLDYVNKAWHTRRRIVILPA